MQPPRFSFSLVDDDGMRSLLNLPSKSTFRASSCISKFQRFQGERLNFVWIEDFGRGFFYQLVLIYFRPDCLDILLVGG